MFSVSLIAGRLIMFYNNYLCIPLLSLCNFKYPCLPSQLFTKEKSNYVRKRIILRTWPNEMWKMPSWKFPWQCPKGFYSTTNGSSECKQCERGTEKFNCNYIEWLYARSVNEVRKSYTYITIKIMKKTKKNSLNTYG